MKRNFKKDISPVMIKMLHNRSTLSLIKNIIQILVNLAIIGGIIFTFIQIKDYRLKESAELVLRFGDYLDEEPYLSITQTIDTDDLKTKILEPNGDFSIGEVDRYLGVYETLGNLYRGGLITCDMLENDFSYYIEKTYTNEDIQNYIKEHPAFWPNLIYLAELFGNGKHCHD